MKRNILLSLVLVLMVGLLCGCGDKEEKTNASNKPNIKVETVDHNDDPQSEGDGLKSSYTGVYLSDSVRDVHGIAFIKDGDSVIVSLKNNFGNLIDSITEDEISGSVIDSKLLNADYSLKFSKNELVYNFPIYEIENLVLKKSTKNIDGVYKNDKYYFIIFTQPNNQVSVVAYNRTLDTSMLEYSTDFKLTSTGGTVNGDDWKVKFNFKLKDGSLTVDLDSNREEWDPVAGTYLKIS